MKKLLLLMASCMFLASCSGTNAEEESSTEEITVAIDKSQPREAAEYLKDMLDLSEEVTEEQVEMYSGIHDAYTVGEEIRVLMNEEQEIEQININNINRTEMSNLLEAIDFPLTDSMKGFMQKTEPEDEVGGDSYFTNYQGVGVNMRMKGSLLNKALGDEKQFSMLLIYNEERFDDFRE